jgi:hypothetical protein
VGQSLIALEKPADTCKVYERFDDDYAAIAPTSVKAQIAGARQRSKCA